MALTVHAQIEEEIFYPQAREATKDNDLIDEAAVEHATVKRLIGEIEAMEIGEELYDAKIRVLGEMVKHHIKEEEEELFPELESAKMDIDVVGKVLAERKEELMAEMQAWAAAPLIAALKSLPSFRRFGSGRLPPSGDDVSAGRETRSVFAGQ